MIIDHADCLHECITDFWSYKLKTSFYEILAHQLRDGGSGRNFRRSFPGISDGFATGKLPDVIIKTVKFSL